MESNTGANAQNLATSATSEGANGAGFADQQQQQFQPENTPQEVAKALGRMGEQGPQAPASPMSMEDRSAAAAARRQAEAQYKAQIAAIEKQQDALAKSRGFENFQEMLDFNNNELLGKGLITQETLAPLVSKALDEHPAIQQARAISEAGAVERSMQEFTAAFPDTGVDCVDDFLKLPNWDGFYGYVSQGLSFVDAYKLSHENDILARRAAAARQATLNHMNGKGHLTETQGNAEDADASIPDETMDYYHNFFPKWTEKQIRSHYAKQKG